MSRKTRKLIWSAPLVAVLAVAGALALFVATVPNVAQAHEPPGPVTNLKAEGISHSEIKVTWDAPETGGAVTGYRIDISENQFTWEALEMDIGNVTEYTHGGLDASTTRHFRVFALNAAGAGPSPVGDTTENDLFVSGTTMAPVAPGQVRSLSATAKSHMQIDLSWSIPAMPGGEDIDRYCIAVGADREHVTDLDLTGTTCDSPADDAAAMTALTTLNTALNADTPSAGGALVVSGKNTTYEHKGLNPELTVYYQAYAINSVGRSSIATNMASAKTMKRPTPGTPGGRKIVPSAADTVNLYWNWPTGQLDIGADDFEIRERSSVATTWSDPVDVPGTTFPEQMSRAPDSGVTTVDGNTATWVEFQVRVELEDGTTGGWSRAARTDWPAPLPAGAGADGLPGLADPTAGGATPLTAETTLNSIKLSWKRLADNDGATPPVDTEVKPTGFVIDAIKGEGGNTGDQKFAFSGLQTNTSYTTESYTHRRLNPGEMWYYRAFPYRSGDQRYGVPIILQTTTMPAVQPDQLACEQVTAAGDGPTKIMLSWGMASNDGGAPISGYHVQVSANGGTGNAIASGATWMNAPDGLVMAPTRTYTYGPEDTPLEAEDSRWFRVIVLNSVITDADGEILSTGDTDPADGVADSINLSAVCPVMGATDASGMPGKPDGLVAEPARSAGGIDPDNPIPDSERGVLLQWNKPADPDGDTVTGYVIQRRTKANSDADWSDWDDDWSEIDASQTAETDDDIMSMLDSGEARQYRVYAKSGAGISESYAEVTYPHDQAVHAPVSTELMAPTNVMTSSTAARTLTFTWEGGENADSYILLAVDLAAYHAGETPYYKDSSINDPNARTGNITALTPGKQYLGIVVAVRGTGADQEYLYKEASSAVPVQ